MICWYCHWGWPKPIADVYDRAARDIDDLLLGAPCAANGWTSPDEPSCGASALDFGPGHVVWSDENFDAAPWCLKACDGPQFAGWYPPALEVVRRSLRELAALPPGVIDCVPADYDGEHPELYPPPPGLEMVKR